MFKKLTGSVLALSIAFTGLSIAPAQAGNNDLAKFLLGVGAIAIIANEVNKNKSKPAPTYQHKPKPHKKPKYADRDGRGHKCMLQRWTNKGWVTYRDPNCAIDRKPKAVHKPKVCLRKKWTNSGWQQYYSAQCLRQHGFRT